MQDQEEASMILERDFVSCTSMQKLCRDVRNKLHESCSEMLPAGEVLVWEQLPQGAE
jgi:hypothetical protein